MTVVIARRAGKVRRALTVALTLAVGSAAGAGGPAAAAASAAQVAANAAAGGAAATRLDNPYAGAEVYLNPEWSARAAAEPGGDAVADQPTAVWLDRIAAIEGAGGRMGLREHLDAALAQGAGLIQLVLHNLPGRDCDRRVSHGELAVGELDRYRGGFVDPIVEILADPGYAGLRIVTVIEPNSLPNLITRTGSRWSATIGCEMALQTGDYVLGVGYAVARLAAIGNVYPYLDISHHGQLGWPDNAGPAANLYAVAATAGGGTLADVHGFVVNTANYSALREEFFTADDVVNGQSVRMSKWVDWNPFVDELPYAQSFRAALVGRGFAAGIGLLVDTSRNGWGGPGRPAGPGPRTTVDAYVDGGRLDRRPTVVAWCNQVGAGLGERPTASPRPGIDAYVWVKPPGESDGAGEVRGPQPYEPMCDPDPYPERAAPPVTGAMPGAPPAGDWFPAHFQALLSHAWPPVDRRAVSPARR